MATRNYSCTAYEKRLKSTHGLTKHINIYTSHQVLSIRMQPKQNTPIPEKDENASENVGPHENEESILEEQDIEEDYRNLGG